jgi:hypothetical protein
MASVRSILVIKAGRARSFLRIRPSPAWTAEEDARLERLLARLEKEGACHHWRPVASEMPRQSSQQCRDRWREHLAHDLYHRPFTAGDDEELHRLFLRHGGRWKEIRRAVPGRTSRVLRRRWKQIRNSDAFLSKPWRRPAAAALLSSCSISIPGTFAPGLTSSMPVF